MNVHMQVASGGGGGTPMGPNEARLLLALSQDEASLSASRRSLAEVSSELVAIQNELDGVIAPELEAAYPSAGGRAAAEATRNLAAAVKARLTEVEASTAALNDVLAAYTTAEADRASLPPVGYPPVPSAGAREEMAEGNLGPAYRAHRQAVAAHEAAKDARESRAGEAFQLLQNRLHGSAGSLAAGLGYGRESDGRVAEGGERSAGNGAGSGTSGGGFGTAPAVAGGAGAAAGAAAAVARAVPGAGPVPGGSGTPGTVGSSPVRVPGAIGSVVPRDIVPVRGIGSTVPDGAPAVDGSMDPVPGTDGSAGAGPIDARAPIEGSPAELSPSSAVAGGAATAAAGLVGLAGGSALLGGLTGGAGPAAGGAPVSTRLGGTTHTGAPGGAIRGGAGAGPAPARPAGPGAAPVTRGAAAGTPAAAARPVSAGAPAGHAAAPRAAGGGAGAATPRAAGGGAGGVAPRAAGGGAGGVAPRAAGGGAGGVAPRAAGGGAAGAAPRAAGGGAGGAAPRPTTSTTGRPAQAAGPRPASRSALGALDARGAGSRGGPASAGVRHSAIGAQGAGPANRPAMVGAAGARGRAEEKDERTDVEIGEDWLSDEDAVGDGVIR